MEEDFFSIDNESFGAPEKIHVNIPELRIGTLVYINNKEHPLHLEQGKIIDKDHLHYKVKIVSLLKDIDNKVLWFPQHWIDPLPKELK